MQVWQLLPASVLLVPLSLWAFKALRCHGVALNREEVEWLLLGVCGRQENWSVMCLS